MELSEIRAELEKVDDRLLDDFLERMKLAGQIATCKAEHDVPVADPGRERETLERVRAKSDGLERYSDALYRQLFSLSRNYQNKLRTPEEGVSRMIADSLERHAGEEFPATATVACPGVEGGNSQIASDRLFPRGNLVFIKTFEGVFDAVEGGLCDFGVVPVENSSNGSVREVYELLQKKSVSIVRSARLFIKHELLARPGTRLEDVRKVYSHPQAFGQCSEFLSGLSSDVELVPCDNTAEAARLVATSGEQGVAAIAPHECVALYDLSVVSDHIQNNENNYTRFFCIAREAVVYPGSNRISLVLTCKHRPGALYAIMGAFEALGINLLKLESCPIPGEDFKFMFFFDLEASVRDSEVRAMLSELERECETFLFLGNYLEV
ncbi:MAG: bifunctional chorismate mutase/prephenate dehydratase [Coriobacteriales bacterium]